MPPKWMPFSRRPHAAAYSLSSLGILEKRWHPENTLCGHRPLALQHQLYTVSLKCQLKHHHHLDLFWFHLKQKRWHLFIDTCIFHIFQQVWDTWSHCRCVCSNVSISITYQQCRKTTALHVDWKSRSRRIIVKEQWHSILTQLNACFLVHMKSCSEMLLLHKSWHHTTVWTQCIKLCVNSKQVHTLTLACHWQFPESQWIKFPLWAFFNPPAVMAQRKFPVLHVRVLNECCCRVYCVNLTSICGSKSR